MIAFSATGFSLDIFRDDFETGTLAQWNVTGNWIAKGGLGDENGTLNGMYSANSSNSGTLATMNRSIDTTGYVWLHLYLRAVTVGLDVNEYLYAKYWNGTAWKTIFQDRKISEGVYLYSLPNDSQNNSQFRLSFGCISNLANEYCAIDDVILYQDIPPGGFEFHEEQTSGGSEIFYRNMTTLADWTGLIADGNGDWWVENTYYSNDTDKWAAFMIKGTASIVHTVNLYGYKDINISFWANTTGNDANEGLYVYYWNGFSWVQIFRQQGDTAAWNYTSKILDAQDVASFKINFTCTDNSVGEQCDVDDVRINGFASNWTQTMINDIMPGNIYSVAIGDANNDGSKDIVIGIDSNTELRIYDNKSGGWVETNISDEPTGVYSVAIGDANNDGQNEIVVGLSSTNNKIRMYNFTGGVWVETNISNISGQATGCYVAIGDVNNDNLNEIAIGLSSSGMSNEVRMYQNVSGGWNETNISDIDGYIQAIAIGDANNDGSKEIVVGGSTLNGGVLMYNRTGGSWVQTIINSTVTTINSVFIGDADNDSQNEVLVGMDDLRMYKNVFGKWRGWKIKTTPVAVYSATIGDANNDGSKEIVIGMASTTNELRMYDNRTGSWVETNISDEPVGVGTIDKTVVIGDAENTGNNFILVGLSSTNVELRAYNTSIPSGGAPPAVGNSTTITLNYPADASTNSTTKNIIFGYTPTAYGTTLKNATLWTNESGWARTKLNLTAITNATVNTIQHNFSANGTYLWTISVWDSNGENFTVNRTLTIAEPAGEGPTVYAFSITVPGNNVTNSNPSFPGNPTPNLEFIYNGSGGGSQFYVNASFNYSGATSWQNSAVPAQKCTNTGNVAITWTIKMNNSWPSNIVMFANDTNAIGGTTTYFIFSSSNQLQLTVAISGTKSLWFYMNFSNINDAGGTKYYNQLNHSSS